MRVLIVTIIAVLLIGFNSEAIAQDNPTISETDTTITIKVGGITCAGNLVEISKKLSGIDGIKSCAAAGPAAAVSKFDITYDPAVVGMEQIIAGVAATESCDIPGTYPFKVKTKKKAD